MSYVVTTLLQTNFTPYGIRFKNGTIFATDFNSNRIQTIASGIVSPFAGSGVSGANNGIGTNATFNSPRDLTIDSSGNIYVADTDNSLIRKITQVGVVSTFAGNIVGSNDGTGTNASFNRPFALTIDNNDVIYVADTLNSLIRKITPAGIVTTIATSVITRGLVIDSSGAIYGVDTQNHRIKKITQSGVVSTFAGNIIGSNDGTGTNASFNRPFALTIDNNDVIYVADTFNNLIRKITPAGVVTTIAGTGSSGIIDGIGTNASFNSPSGITIDNGIIYIAENDHIRQITFVPEPILPILPISNICFLKNTIVQTDQGKFPIQTLTNQTIHRMPITLTKTIHFERYLVKINAYALGGFPTEDTYMSLKHRIYLTMPIQAKNLVNNETITLVPYNGETLFNVLLDKHVTMKVNGMLVETLDPSCLIAMFYKSKLSPKQKDAMILTLNKEPERAKMLLKTLESR